jgi:hypothetical protein
MLAYMVHGNCMLHMRFIAAFRRTREITLPNLAQYPFRW